MREVTRLKFLELSSTAWFSNIGTAVPDSRYALVGSSVEALKLAEAKDWERHKTRLNGELCRAHRQRYRKWNDLIDEIAPLVSAAVTSTLSKVSSKGIPANDLRELIQFDAVMWLMEVEFSDVVCIQFFSDLMSVYCDGRFPCGWEGSYPVGRFVVW